MRGNREVRKPKKKVESVAAANTWAKSASIPTLVPKTSFEASKKKG